MAQATTSLHKRGADLSDSSFQLNVLHHGNAAENLPSFGKKLGAIGLLPLSPLTPEILQVNVGKMCNQACKHCHVDAGPDRTEIMTRETMQQCLDVLARTDIGTVDLTGGAPEMNPDFRWFVENISALGRKIIVRCNLTIIVANPKYRDLPEFYAKHGVHVMSSLPFYDARHTDRQRGGGVFDDSMEAMKLLNAVGYGIDGTGLLLDLVYNPLGALLPGPQASLEKEFKNNLWSKNGVSFNSLHCITNMPISRFLEYLIDSGNYGQYMETLVNAFNPVAAQSVMCRNTISVGWDGALYDCDFNQMLELPVATPSRHISTFDLDALNRRSIVIDQHCFGCTAGAGSSCGGQLT
ncbi:MAG: arsenosugar biosynthesis radical SAM protein ArsS [Candidatus Kapabacteria bacterium]|nr:arsenosugar biosynthesis radical SAM protein ArsS [Candidatus Kapabacteria bacterium]